MAFALYKVNELLISSDEKNGETPDTALSSCFTELEFNSSSKQRTKENLMEIIKFFFTKTYVNDLMNFEYFAKLPHRYFDFFVLIHPNQMINVMLKKEVDQVFVLSNMEMML